MVKQVDLPVYLSLRDYAAGVFQPGIHVLGLADGGIEYATSGGFVDELVEELEDLKRRIIAGEITVPALPERFN